MKHVSKTFGSYTALDDFSLVLGKGEVHCLAGENGSGKSTAIKVLAGILPRDAGSIRLLAHELGDHEVQRAIDLGLAVIYQDLSLLPNLSVAENIGMPSALRRGEHIARYAHWRRKAADTFAMMGVSVGLDVLVETLPVAEKQLVAIARAVAAEALVIVMDEPTTALTRSEVTRLFDLVRTLKTTGVSFLFVSHKFEEIFGICDSITVLRDGKIVATGPTSELDRRSLALAMTGRPIVEERLALPVEGHGEERLRVEGLSRSPDFYDVSLSIRAGEIVSIVGLLGSGQRELALCLFGLLRQDAGACLLDAIVYAPASAADALRMGVVLVPEDRLSEGLFLDRSIADNAGAASLGAFTAAFAWLKTGPLRRTISQFVTQLRIKMTGPDQSVGRLSGGNQQRVMLARFLMRASGDDPQRP
ncbi:MAG: sugar ABC transporter ATP-binding protein [Rhizobiaceae bacterium]|nr:sugar ABC transporter ATP-binding protein [Rhizobiaceae bacterium]